MTCNIIALAKRNYLTKKNIPKDVAIALIYKPIASDLRALSKENYLTKKKQYHNGYSNYIDP